MRGELADAQLALPDKLARVSWAYVAAIVLLGAVGYAMLYSAAGGSHEPWAWRHAVRLAFGVLVMLFVALVDPRLWHRFAYLAYGGAFAALVGVEIVGSLAKGAQRWIDLGFVQLQPSELMKVALVLALARYFHGATPPQVGRPLFLLPPIAMIAAPALLVLKQPDLGTAVMLLASGAVVLFLAGVRWWKFALVGGGAAAALPLIWGRLHAYQRERVLTFLDPDQDPLGAGYHIIQSKIALGSGGFWGKGFLEGTQAQLSFLPEKHTDFVFTMLAEEQGLAGGLAVLALYLVVFLMGLVFALRTRSQFGRLVAAGASVTFFLYVVINVAMVTGLIPVVGVPLPLVSYGGTAMMTVMVGCGLALGIDVHRDLYMRRHPDDDL
ncbi:MAG: rod shape-determining protein RodA [Alphaproteobacteria bacterium]|nr:rod shape-determining protein RodA [Alphaproteobacteria bacterium]